MVVGFERTSYLEREDVGQFQVCVVVTIPSISQPLNRAFSLSVSTRTGTAGTYLIQYSMRYKKADVISEDLSYSTSQRGEMPLPFLSPIPSTKYRIECKIQIVDKQCKVKGV